MAKKKHASGSRNGQDEQIQQLESIFDLTARDSHARREFGLSINRLRTAIQAQQSYSSEDDWLLLVEQSAAQVREACSAFRDDSDSRRDHLYRLLRSLEDSTASTSPSESNLIDRTRIVLVCRSLMASCRLQAQLDEQVVEELLSFLSRLYVVIDFPADSSESNNGKPQRKDLIGKFNGWIENIENQTFLTGTPWQEALEEMYRCCCLEKARTLSTTMYYHTAADEPGESQYLVESSPEASSSLPMVNPIAGSDSILSAVDCFLGLNDKSMPSLSFLVVVGKQGSGKTFLCNQIERKAVTYVPSVQVVRPTLPIDLMGASLGETEDTISSTFDFARQSRKCILLLDDIDRILGQEEGSSPPAVGDGVQESDAPPHIQMRILSTFLSQLDSFRASQAANYCQVLVIGTTGFGDNVGSIGRVDKVFHLDLPSDMERRDIIVQSLNLSTNDVVINSNLLTDLVDCTVGRSRSELVQYCRQAVSSGSLLSMSALDSEEMLCKMKATLQSLKPESLRSGVVSDFVDMTVLTAKDLVDTTVNPDAPVLPLFGDDARQAWEEMKALIVMPLCQANELDSLLYGDSNVDRKTVCGGVLLAGSPGSGKSSLAYHCANVAASLVPSMTLIDVSCTSLVHKEVGGSERALRHLFSSAKAAVPCILIMDGIENIAGVRGHDNTTEGTMDRILSTLLIELDGVESQSDEGGKVAVIGITHNENWIDPALRRPGRLEKVIKLQMPDDNARHQIVLKELCSSSLPNSRQADTNELVEFVARRTAGMSGAEVLALCREARLEKVRELIEESNEMVDGIDGSVTREHFLSAGLEA